MRTIYEYSAGVIPFHYQEDFFPLYLVIHSAAVRNPNARWEFPKGGIQRGESVRQAAAREFEEETGITSWAFHDGFVQTISYTYVRSGRRRNKTVTYFVAEVLDSSGLRCSREHMADPFGHWCRWGPFEEINTILSHVMTRSLLTNADAFIRNLTPRLFTVGSYREANCSPWICLPRPSLI